MSRLSRANLKGRDSVFAGGPDLYRGDIQATCPPSLEECVMIMEDCCEQVPPADFPAGGPLIQEPPRHTMPRFSSTVAPRICAA
jgi:hypothetical protein